MNFTVNVNVGLTPEAQQFLTALVSSAGFPVKGEQLSIEVKGDSVTLEEKPKKTRKSGKDKPEEQEGSAEVDPLIETPATAVKTETSAIFLEQVQEAITKVVQKGDENRVKVKNILTDDFMVANARALDPKEYPAFLEALSKL